MLVSHFLYYRLSPPPSPTSSLHPSFSLPCQAYGSVISAVSKLLPLTSWGRRAGSDWEGGGDSEEGRGAAHSCSRAYSESQLDPPSRGPPSHPLCSDPSSHGDCCRTPSQWQAGANSFVLPAQFQHFSSIARGSAACWHAQLGLHKRC
jgi:hypothetical protein